LAGSDFQEAQMTDRLYPALALGTLVVVGALASAAPGVSAASSQPVTTAAAPDTRVMSQDASGMVALQQHAHVNMLLDGGHPDRPSLASVRWPVDAVALTLPSGAK
jgi:hypothetical protein